MRAAPFLALICFTFILLVGPQWHFRSLVNYRIALIMAVVVIATYLLEKIVYRRPIVRLTREIRITAFLVGWAVLSIPFSYWPGGSVSFLFDFYFKTIVIFWLLSHVVDTESRLRQFTWGLSLMAIPMANSAVNQYMSGQVTPDRMGGRIVGYAAPLSSNPNDLALMLNLILPLSVALFLSSRRAVHRVILLGVMALLTVGVIVTFSRAGFLTLAMTFAVYQWKLRKRPERGWALAALVVVALTCIPLLPSDYFERLGTIVNIEADETGSARMRWKDMGSAVEYALRNPIIGAGVGMGVLALNEERGRLWKEVHSVYLQYAVDMGIPGLFLFLLLLRACVTSVTTVQRRCKDSPTLQGLFYLAEGIQVSLIAFSTAAFFHPVAYHFYFYYIAGIASALPGVYERQRRLLSEDIRQTTVRVRQVAS